MSQGYSRRRNSAVRLRLKATLRSDDTAEQRADNVLAMMGALWEPADRALVKEGIVEVLRDYAELDRAVRR